MAYGIGLDIGIASVGFATVALDEHEEPCGILHMGVRVFDEAENPKDGSSLAAPRRKARSMRRRIRRKRHRMERIRKLIIACDLLTPTQLEHLFDGKLRDIYQLRADALDRLVSDEEFARILIHLAQRRGFRSNRKSDASDQEAGKLLEAVKKNALRMADNGYRTVGEMLYRDPSFAGHKRNKSEEYLATVARESIRDEAKLLFETQRELGNIKLSQAFEDAYCEILLSQRSFEDGPGSPSPYGGFAGTVGKCTFETEEQRAPKASYSFERFQLLQKVNTIRISHNGESRFLTADERALLVDLVHRTADVSYERIRKALKLADEDTFHSVYYRLDGSNAEKKQKLTCLKAYHEMRKALDHVEKGRIGALSTETRNTIAYAFTMYKTDDKIRAYLEANAAELTEADIGALLAMRGFSKFGHLSVKACEKLIPHLEKGMQYHEACTAAGYQFRAHDDQERRMLLPAIRPDSPESVQITSPVVRRAISQTIKVLNALIREQGESPMFVNIELAREMAKDKKERDESTKMMQKNAAENQRIYELLQNELHIASPKGQDIIKYRLYEEQQGLCLYSLQPFDLQRLFEPGYAEVDHIIPYSISFDDRFSNKALVFASENRKKGNRLPLQYLSGQQKDDFRVYVEAHVRSYRKKQALLKQKITEEERSGFRERNLQDTKTISRFLYNYINDHLQFAPSATGRKRRVVPVNGSVTAYLRKRWNIQKVRENGDLHHAMDALVVACTTQGLIQRVTRYADAQETCYMQTEDGSYLLHPETGEIRAQFPAPWEGFRQEWTARISSNPRALLEAMKLPNYRGLEMDKVKPIFVSRMPRHKVTGAAHKETIKSRVETADGTVVLTKTALIKLKLKDGEIEGYYNPASDRLLYEALRDRLIAFDGKADKAFAEPFYKPKSDGSQGPLVKKVKIAEKATLHTPVHHGQAVADNDSMVRIDVFRVAGDGYYFVPIYVADTVKPELPNRAVVQAKPYEQWKPMRSEDFLFSLYPGDAVCVANKKGIEMGVYDKNSSLAERTYRPGEREVLYYCGANTANGSIAICNHDRTYKVDGLGVKRLTKFEKYQVDVLGGCTRVARETRQTFRQG